jgi:hypothetical protein
MCHYHGCHSFEEKYSFNNWTYCSLDCATKAKEGNIAALNRYLETLRKDFEFAKLDLRSNLLGLILPIPNLSE